MLPRRCWGTVTLGAILLLAVRTSGDRLLAVEGAPTFEGDPANVAHAAVVAGKDLPEKRDAARALTAPQAQQIDATFNQLLFGGAGADAVQAARSRLAHALQVQIDVLDLRVHLTDSQRGKLDLAGRGDIRRLYGQIQDLRRRFQLDLRDQADVTDLEKLDPATSRLWKVVLDEPYATGSLFDKMRRKLLTAEQLAKLPNDDSETPRIPALDPRLPPRQVTASGLILIIDHRKLRGHQAEFDKLLEPMLDLGTGRGIADSPTPAPASGISVVTHNICNAPEFDSLLKEGIISILSRPVIRSVDHQYSAIWVGQEHLVGSVQPGVYLEMSPTVLPDDQIRVKMAVGIRSSRRKAGAVFEMIPAIGDVRRVLTVPAGRHLVFRGMELPSSGPAVEDPDEQTEEVESTRGDPADARCKRELMVILSPVVASLVR